MEFVERQLWSNGQPFRLPKELGTLQEEAPPKLKDLQRWLGEPEEQYSITLTATSTDPSTRQSLAEWRKKVMKVVENTVSHRTHASEDYLDEFVQKTKKEPKQHGGGQPPHRVRCIETGQVFATVKAACREYKMDPATLRKALKNPKWSGAGYHWENYVEEGMGHTEQAIAANSE